MKKLLPALLMLPMAAGAQTQNDYQRVMDQFVAYYNDQKHSDVCTLFPNKEIMGKECFWMAVNPDESFKKYGKILSYSFLGVAQDDPAQVSVFKVVFEHKKEKAMSFTLDRENHFGTFRFDTSSEEIEKMLAGAE